MAAGTYLAPVGGFAILNPNKRFTIRAATGALVVLSGNNTQPVLQYQVSVTGAARPRDLRRPGASGTAARPPTAWPAASP